MNTEILERIGLTKNEIKVYLALLKNGESTTSPLINSTEINSSKVYESLERLQRKGLVSYVKKSNKRYYHPVNPEHLLDYVDEKKKKLEKEKEEINKLVPELNDIMKRQNEEKQEAEIYQGQKGYRTVLEGMLSDLGRNGKYFVFASGMLKEALGDYWFIFQKKKRQLGIKALCLWDEKIRHEKDYLKEYYGKGRFLVKGQYKSPVDIWVYNDKIVLVSYTTKPLFCVLIRSKGLADGYRDLFNNLWKEAKN